MSLQNLFSAIRKEDAALWVGAGLSMYAGYPSGNGLQKILYAALNNDERIQVAPTSSLKKTAQALVTFRSESKNELLKILRKEFDREPLATHVHDLLSRIPHFKDIITTNYDSMLETSYNRRAIVVRSPKEIPLIESGRTAIFKPHGDLQNLDRIVITEDDYSTFYNLNKGDPFWSAIFNIIAQKTQVFLGYGFEDDNIWAWFDMIDNYIGPYRKERFLIAPNWNELQIKRLAKWHIKYIDMTGDKFFNDLNEELKLTIASDLENGIVSQDTFNKYITFHNFNSGIANDDGKPRIVSLQRSDKTPTTTKIKFCVTDDRVARKLDKFNNGFGRTVKIENDQLDYLDLFIDDFKMNVGVHSIQSFHIVRLSKKYKFSIEFPDEDFMIEDLVFESFQTDDKRYKLTSDVFGFKVQVNLLLRKDGIRMNFDFKAPEKLPSINKCIQFQTAVTNYFKGCKALINWEFGIKDITAIYCEEYYNHMNQSLLFYKNLKKIERFFDVNFEGAILNSSTAKLTTAQYLTDLIENKYSLLHYEQVALSIENETEEKKFRNFPTNINSLLVKTGIEKDIELLGKKIPLGEAGVEIVDIEIGQFNEEKTMLFIKSKTGRFLQRYRNITSFDVPNI